MKKNLIFRWLFWSATVGVMLIVFLNSAKNAAQSSEISISFSDKIFSVIIPNYDSMDETEKLSLVTRMQFLIRKSAHFAVYSGMGFFCFLATNTYNLKLVKKFLISTAICVIYAITDEIHQIFVPGRSGEIRDVLIDSSGILLATLSLTFVFYIIKKRREKRNEKAIEANE